MMDGVFWYRDMGFVVDPQHMASRFPNSESFDQRDFDQVLKSSEKLPSLGPAPVASWLLARMFQLTRERLGFETHTRVYNDGGGYYLNLIAFTRDLKPAAFFNLHGDSLGIRMWGTCAADCSLETVKTAFTEALLENPSDLMPCKLTTIDTDPLDLEKRRLGKPHVYGWDGSKFLGFRKKPTANRG